MGLYQIPRWKFTLSCAAPWPCRLRVPLPCLDGKEFCAAHLTKVGNPTVLICCTCKIYLTLLTLISFLTTTSAHLATRKKTPSYENCVHCFWLWTTWCLNREENCYMRRSVISILWICCEIIGSGFLYNEWCIITILFRMVDFWQFSSSFNTF